MAGPGGGPPRRSHTKSRKGCKTCKRRHIRCDETTPQCRNCTKHNCRCDYMDSLPSGSERSQSPRGPDLLMTPEIEAEINRWRINGNPPFAELQMSSPSYWYKYSATDMRLIHHIAGLSIDLHRRGYSDCTVWTQKMPIFLAIALSSPFVMSSILALSASHLAWITRCRETENLAYHHQGVALTGLREALRAFSRDNCEAILAASMLLSWQASEWREWASLQHGMSTVLNAMEPWWKQESDLARYVENQKVFKSSRSHSIPGYDSPFHNEDLVRLDHACINLQNMQQRMAHSQEQYLRISELLGFLQKLREDLPLQAPEEAFQRLHTLRTWLFWLPPAMLTGEETDLGALAVLSQYYGVALALEPLFPEFGGSYLGGMSVIPIEEIHRILVARNVAQPYAPEVQLALALMEFPCDIVADYRLRLTWSPRPSMDHYPPLSPYSVPSIHAASPLQSPSSVAVSSPTYLHPRSSLDYPKPMMDHSPHLSPGSLGDIMGLGAGGPDGGMGSGYFTQHGFDAGGLVAPEIWT